MIRGRGSPQNGRGKIGRVVLPGGTSPQHPFAGNTPRGRGAGPAGGGRSPGRSDPAERSGSPSDDDGSTEGVRSGNGSGARRSAPVGRGPGSIESTGEETTELATSDARASVATEEAATDEAVIEKSATDEVRSGVPVFDEAVFEEAVFDAAVSDEPAPAAPEDLRGARPALVPPQFAGPVVSVLVRPLYVIVPTLVLLVGALAYTAHKAPSYTADARLIVGRQDAPANAIPGYVGATQVLASDYARLVSSQGVESRLATALSLPARDVSGQVSASPIPQSSLISVQATGATAARAVSLANAATQALIDYVNQTVAGSNQSATLLDRYNQAELSLLTAQAKVTSSQTALTLATARRDDAGVLRATSDLNAAQAAVAADQLQVTATGAAYNTAVSNGDAAPLTVVSPAAGAGSNRKSNVEAYGALGLVAGLVLGVLLAMWRANLTLIRSIRRRQRAAFRALPR